MRLSSAVHDAMFALAKQITHITNLKQSFMRSAMISKLTLILAVASIAVAGCKKDKGPQTQPVEQTKKISRVEENGQTTATFQYNTDGSVKTITMDIGILDPVTFTFSYNAQKKVDEINTGGGDKVKFIYQGGILVWAENYEAGQKVSENNFTYENGKMKSNTLLTGFPQGGGTIIYRPTYRAVYHYAANGNVQKVSTYVLDDNDQLVLENETAYQQYDAKKNPLAQIAEFSQAVLYQPVSVNNPVIEKWLSDNGAVLETTDNVYTYDAAGYPTTLKSTTTVPGQTPTVRNVKFFY